MKSVGCRPIENFWFAISRKETLSRKVLQIPSISTAAALRKPIAPTFQTYPFFKKCDIWPGIEAFVFQALPYQSKGSWSRQFVC